MFKKLLLISTLLAGSGLLTVNAAPVLSINPSTLTVNQNDSFSITGVLSGLEENNLDEILAAFEIEVGFDSSVLALSSVTTDPFPFFVTLPSIDDVLATTNSLNRVVTSFEDDAVLQVHQGDSITLFTAFFTALRPGSSAFTFITHDLTGLNFEFLDHSVQNGRVTVNGNGVVPEPATLLLMGLGALGMFGAKRRQV